MKNKSFLGYGNPQALEAALKVDDEHFEIAQESLLNLVVCSDLPQEEVIKRMRMRPSGTTAGWVFCEAESPVDCSQKKGFKHYLFEC